MLLCKYERLYGNTTNIDIGQSFSFIAKTFFSANMDGRKTGTSMRLTSKPTTSSRKSVLQVGKTYVHALSTRIHFSPTRAPKTSSGIERKCPPICRIMIAIMRFPTIGHRMRSTFWAVWAARSHTTGPRFTRSDFRRCSK